jgi:hypothetical protein
MRLISQFDISRLYQEKLDNIIRDYAESYVIKVISEKPSNINTGSLTININNNISTNPGKPQILQNISNDNQDITKFPISITNGMDINGSQNLELNGIYFILTILHSLYFLLFY